MKNQPLAGVVVLGAALGPGLGAAEKIAAFLARILQGPTTSWARRTAANYVHTSVVRQILFATNQYGAAD